MFSSLNFGHGIFAFYVLFVGSLAFQVYRSTQISNALVDKQYYNQDIAYQSTMEARARSAKQPILLLQGDAGKLSLGFAAGQSAEEVSLQLQRPDAREEDRLIELATVDAVQPIDMPALSPGRWNAVIRYHVNGQLCVREQSLYIR